MRNGEGVRPVTGLWQCVMGQLRQDYNALCGFSIGERV